MPLPSDVQALFHDLLPALQGALGGALVGLYVRGSLALGDFNPETSDVDVLAVTETPLTDAQFEALAAMHERLASAPNRYAGHLESVYFDQAAVRRYEPYQVAATLGRGESLAWKQHSTNWIVERWTVREHGLVLFGPDPRTLIDPIAPDDLIAANRARIADWVRWVDEPEDSDWDDGLRSQMAYATETMCRCLYAIGHGTIASKPAAVRWALATIPEPWRETVERSQQWRADRTSDPVFVAEVQRLIHWAGATTGG